MKINANAREWIFAAIRGALIENPRLRFNEDQMAEACTRVVVTVLESLDKKSFSAAITDAMSEESNLDDPHFKGETYEKDIDQKALTKDLFKVFAYLVEHPNTYVTDVEIAEATGAYLPSVPRFRCYLATKEYGSHTMLRRRRTGERLHEHCMIVNRESLTYQAWFKANSTF